MGYMAARNMQRIEINTHEKELCFKLFIYESYTEMHGQQNIIHNNMVNVLLRFHGKAFNSFYILRGDICKSIIKREVAFPW